MDKCLLLDLLPDVKLPFVEENAPLRWIFQYDRDPKHAAKLVGDLLRDNTITSLESPAQCPDSKPIEHL